MIGNRIGAHVVTMAIVLSAACELAPPASLDDAEVADVYGQVLIAVRQELGIDGRLVIHPYLSISADSTGRPTVEIDDFDYVPSEALRLAQLRDTLLMTCRPDPDGACPGSRYLILSRPIQTGRQDAAVIAILIDRDGGRRPEYVSVRLRYRREAWSIAAATRISARPDQ